VGVRGVGWALLCAQARGGSCSCTPGVSGPGRATYPTPPAITRTRARTHARTHAHTHAHTQDDNGRVIGATCRDAISGRRFEVHAKVVINAAGACCWSCVRAARRSLWCCDLALGCALRQSLRATCAAVRTARAHCFEPPWRTRHVQHRARAQARGWTACASWPRRPPPTPSPRAAARMWRCQSGTARRPRA
jgi:hypothetical protein